MCVILCLVDGLIYRIDSYQFKIKKYYIILVKFQFFVAFLLCLCCMCAVMYVDVVRWGGKFILLAGGMGCRSGGHVKHVVMWYNRAARISKEEC